MKIEVGRYTIIGDSYCLWITETRETKDPKTKKKTGKVTTERVAGYSLNFEELMEDFIDRKTRNSDAATLKQMLRDIASAEKDAKKIVKTINATRKEMLNVGEKRIHKG